MWVNIAANGIACGKCTFMELFLRVLLSSPLWWIISFRRRRPHRHRNRRFSLTSAAIATDRTVNGIKCETGLSGTQTPISCTNDTSFKTEREENSFVFVFLCMEKLACFVRQGIGSGVWPPKMQLVRFYWHIKWFISCQLSNGWVWSSNDTTTMTTKTQKIM